MRIRIVGAAALAILAVGATSTSVSAQGNGIIKRADQLNDEGKDLFGRGELDEAASKFRAAIALSPQARYFFNLCFVLNARKEYRAALGACHEVRTSPGLDERLGKRTEQLITAIEKKRKAAGDKPVPPPIKDPPPDPPPKKVSTDPPPTDPPRNPPGNGMPDPNAPPPITTPPSSRPPIAGYVPPRTGPIGIAKPLPPRRIHVGANLGFSTASLAGSDADFSSVRAGFTAGLYVASSFSRRIAGQIEIDYVQRGGSATSFGGGNIDFDVELNYISVPVLAKVLIPVGRVVRFHGDGGFGLSFLTSSEATAFDFGGGPAPVLFDQPGVDFSLIVGGGLTLHRQGRNAWTFDFRYEFGLADVTPEGVPDMRSRTTTLRVGYAY